MAHEWFKPKQGYEAPDLGATGEHDPFVRADRALTLAVADKLERHYPGHPWLIEASHKQGVVMISIPIFMGWKRKYVIHISALKSDPGMRHVVRAGGEILERFKMPRQAFSDTDYVNALNAMPSFARGRHGLAHL